MASELVTKIQQIVAKYGDAPVGIIRPDSVAGSSDGLTMLSENVDIKCLVLGYDEEVGPVLLLSTELLHLPARVQT